MESDIYKDILERLAKAISAKYGIDFRLENCRPNGYVFVVKLKHSELGDAVIAAYEYPTKFRVATPKELFDNLLACQNTIIWTDKRLTEPIRVNVAKEFGKTIEEIKISCDLTCPQN